MATSTSQIRKFMTVERNVSTDLVSLLSITSMSLMQAKLFCLLVKLFVQVKSTSVYVVEYMYIMYK